ncbi:hypothetical protein F5877DRAFT_83740 [Lentinula edodes]|nr:hypothetical protein F5877DRAFT_83740 [Lentinula edodes]
MTVWDVVRTKSDDNVVLKSKKGVGSGIGMKEEEENRRVGRVLYALGPEVWERANVGGTGTQSGSAESSRGCPSDAVSPRPPSQQRVVHLMHALLGCAPFILLDKAWSGMDEIMVRVAGEYLRGDSSSTSKSAGGGAIGFNQVVVVIAHWEKEVPWSRDEDPGVFKQFRLGGGKGLVRE